MKTENTDGVVICTPKSLSRPDTFFAPSRSVLGHVCCRSDGLQDPLGVQPHLQFGPKHRARDLHVVVEGDRFVRV